MFAEGRKTQQNVVYSFLFFPSFSIFCNILVTQSQLIHSFPVRIIWVIDSSAGGPWQRQAGHSICLNTQEPEMPSHSSKCKVISHFTRIRSTFSFYSQNKTTNHKLGAIWQRLIHQKGKGEQPPIWRRRETIWYPFSLSSLFFQCSIAEGTKAEVKSRNGEILVSRVHFPNVYLVNEYASHYNS